MHAHSFIQVQLNAIHTLLHECAEDLSETEWTRPAFPGANPIGSICWHMVRSQDWAVQTAIRGVPEVIMDERWSGWSGPALETGATGIGIISEQANEVAYLVARPDLLAYADAVHETIDGWLVRLSNDDFDAVPDMEVNMAAFPAYQQPGFLLEIGHLFGLPMWRLLSSVCSGHQRGHLGELDLLKQILRGSGGWV